MAVRNPTSPTTAQIAAAGAGTNSESSTETPAGATNPPYVYAILGPTTNGLTRAKDLDTDEIVYVNETVIREQWPGKVFPDEPQEASSPTTNTTVAEANPQEEIAPSRLARQYPDTPHDIRLSFAIDDTTGAVVYSYDARNEHPLVEGFVMKKEPRDDADLVMANTLSDADLQTRAKEFYGVPSVMNPNAYINLGAAGGRTNNRYLIDRENQVRWYNKTEPGLGDGGGVQSSTAPTVPEIVAWASQEVNRFKFPYKYSDFAFCKWWKKIPNNYMITLRRYPYPVNDAVVSSEEAAGRITKKDTLSPVSTMITFLGEDPGNKMSTILGPVETGLKWKPLKADVWEVSTTPSTSSVNNPAPQIASVLGFLAYGGDGTKSKSPGPVPPDPYSNGPYANKIIGPVNVIESTMMRERGLEFKHEITLIFEYSLRSIGGVNTKAIGLDIIANCMLMTSATAPFWGGQNRYLPSAGGGTSDPFLGGPAGLAAWKRGDPEGFFNALKTQFNQIFSNVSDLFNKVKGMFDAAGGDPIQGLQNVVAGGAKAALGEFMKMSTSHQRGTVTGIHSLLTGTPVGEWHLCVGPPMNPMMMIGNLICKSGKLEFSDELGPDDFPTEIKFTVVLDHGMPRDKAGIESMFNKGRGRIYSLPAKYEESFASTLGGGVDKAQPARYRYQANSSAPFANNGNNAETNRDVAFDRKFDTSSTNTKPVVATKFGALYALGFGDSKQPSGESSNTPNTPTNNA